MNPNPAPEDRPPTGESFAADTALAGRVLAGEEAAVDELLAAYGPALRSYLGGLARRGRQQALAEEIAADVLHLCSLPAGALAAGEKLSLARYSGTGSLGAWLQRVAHFRFINAVGRGEQRRTTLACDLEGTAPLDALESAPPAVPEVDAPWLEVIREALRDALRRAGEESPEGVVFLRLVFLHGLQRQRLAGVWRRHPAQVTRWLQESRDRIRGLTLESLAALDPHFDLRWEDLLAVVAEHRGSWWTTSAPPSPACDEEGESR